MWDSWPHQVAALYDPIAGQGVVFEHREFAGGGAV